MNGAARWLLQIYPRRWRERYEAEVAALLEEHDVTLVTCINLLLGAIDARLDPHYYFSGGLHRMDQVQFPRLANRATFWAFFCFFASYIFAILDQLDGAWDAVRGTPSVAATAYGLAQASGGILVLTLVVTSITIELARARAVRGILPKLRHAAAGVGLPLASVGTFALHDVFLHGMPWDYLLFLVILGCFFAIAINLGFVVGSSDLGEFETRIARIASVIMGLGMTIFVVGLVVVQTLTSTATPGASWSAATIIAFALLLVPTIVTVGAVVAGRCASGVSDSVG